jgi:hypothetical protein
MSTASLSTRLGKLRAADGNLSLDEWRAIGARNLCAVPTHGLVSIVIGRLIPKHLADVFYHPLCAEWREGQDINLVAFQDWLAERGTSLDAVLEEVQRDLGAR